MPPPFPAGLIPGSPHPPQGRETGRRTVPRDGGSQRVQGCRSEEVALGRLQALPLATDPLDAGAPGKLRTWIRVLMPYGTRDPAGVDGW